MSATGWFSLLKASSSYNHDNIISWGEFHRILVNGRMLTLKSFCSRTIDRALYISIVHWCVFFLIGTSYLIELQTGNTALERGRDHRSNTILLNRDNSMVELYRMFHKMCTHFCWPGVDYIIIRDIHFWIHVICLPIFFIYITRKNDRQTFNISGTKSQYWTVSRLVLQLSLPSPLKSDVKSRMKL